jgi:hypothetical protein
METRESVDRLNRLLEELHLEFPRFKIVPKYSSWIMRLLGKILFFNRAFMTEYMTTFGTPTLYVPGKDVSLWLLSDPTSLYVTLRHERVHMRDGRRFPVIFQLTYLLLLPLVLTFRSFWEWRAYRETIIATKEARGWVSMDQIEVLVRQFTGPGYLFMAPFPRFWRRKFLRLLKSLGQEV